MPQMKAKVHLPLQHPIVSYSTSPVIHVERKKTQLWVKLSNLQQDLENLKAPGGLSGWLAAQVEALPARPQRTECSIFKLREIKG